MSSVTEETRLTRSSAFFFSSAVMVEGFLVAAATAEESALASLFLKEETAAAARARIGAAGGEEEGSEAEEEEEEVEAADADADDESGMAPAAEDGANDDDATAIRLLETAAGALFGAETTRDDVRRTQTAGREAAMVGARGSFAGRERGTERGEVEFCIGRRRPIEVCFRSLSLSSFYQVTLSTRCPEM